MITCSMHNKDTVCINQNTILQDGNASGILEDNDAPSPVEAEVKKEPLLPAQAPPNPSSRYCSFLHYRIDTKSWCQYGILFLDFHV